MISMLVRLRTEQPYDQGDFVFSSSRGKYPLTNFSKKKNAFLEEFNAAFRQGLVGSRRADGHGTM